MNKILETYDLCKTYVVNKRQNHVLKNVNLTINEGEFITIMGPSGSGKSTLLYNVSGMDMPTAGKVKFDGEDITAVTPDEMANLRLSKMGFVFQQMNLLKNLGIIDNIIIPGYMSDKKNKSNVNIYAKTLMKKTGIIELSENDITQASGGQLQRVAICRALINKPKIIFADEPTGALNSKSASEIMDIFKVINEENTTIMVVSHDVKVASRSERILYMIDGDIIGELTLSKFVDDASLKERELKLTNWLLEKGW